MKLIDHTLFNGELITKLRLEYMYPFIDKFYICEKRYTYQGKKKDTLFIETCFQWFLPYLDKIVFLIDEVPPSGNAWSVEKQHRNYAVPFILRDFTEPFLCINADIDEIPNMEALMLQKESLYAQASKAPVYLMQKLYYYNLHWFVHGWDKAFLITDSLLRQNGDIEQYRCHAPKQQIFAEGGWHLSYFMTRAEILRKIESFSHTEFNNDHYKNNAFIDSCLKEGYDLFRRREFPKHKYQDSSQHSYPPCFHTFHTQLLALQTA